MQIVRKLDKRKKYIYIIIVKGSTSAVDSGHQQYKAQFFLLKAVFPLAKGRDHKQC